MDLHQQVETIDVRIREGACAGEFAAAVRELWQDIYVAELGWVTGEAIRHNDEYHEYSTYVLIDLVRDGEPIMPVATARIVEGSQQGLPIERFLPLGPLKEDRHLIEVQKLMVRPSFRSRRFPSAPLGLMSLIMQRSMQFAVTNNASMIIADVFDDPQVSPIGPLRQIGFERIGVPFVDTELGSPVASVAMAISRGMFLRSLVGGADTTMLRFLRGELSR